MGQIYTHEQLQNYVGYESLALNPEINRAQFTFLSYYLDRNESWFNEINDYLRFEDHWFGYAPKQLESAIVAIDTLLDKTHGLPKDLILFRGQDMNFLGRHLKIGETFIERAYLSTTSDLHTSRMFSGFGTMSFVMILYFEDAPGRGLVVNSSDYEVLLQRNLNLKVMDSIRNGTRRYGLVQICPEEGCADKVSNMKVLNWWESNKDIL